MTCRNFLHLAAGAAVALPLIAFKAWAQTYLARPVTLVHGFAPAGVDTTARIVAEGLTAPRSTVHRGTAGRIQHHCGGTARARQFR